MLTESLVEILRGSEGTRAELSRLLETRDGRALSERAIDLLVAPAARERDAEHDCGTTQLNVESERAALGLRAGLLEHWTAELEAMEPEFSPGISSVRSTPASSIRSAHLAAASPPGS